MTTRRYLFVGGAGLVLVGAGAADAVVQEMGSLSDYNASVAASRAAIRQASELEGLLQLATLAPSGHNAQPWKFRVSADRIRIEPDFSRRTPIVDPDDHHLFVSLGCAAENLALACRAQGRPGELHFDASNKGAAVFEFSRGSSERSPLFDAIPRRQSTRREYDGKAVSSADLNALSLAAAVPGVDLSLITDRGQLNRFRDLVIASNTIQMADKAFVRELRSWMRFSPREALRTGDGLFSATSGYPILPAWLGPTFFDLAFNARDETDAYARHVTSSSGVAVFIGRKEDPEHWVLAGRACQRFALQATLLGLKCAFLNQPVEVAGQRPALASLVGLPDRRPDLVLRYGYGPSLPYSARRPLDARILL
jgi:nitroreductase